MIIEIAGINVEIKTESAYVERYVSAWQAARGATPDMTVRVTPDEISAEKQKTLSMLASLDHDRREAYINDYNSAFDRQKCEFDDGYIESVCLYRKICDRMPMFDAFLLHGALLECRGRGVEFLGASGAGKSTHSNLWLEYFDDVHGVNGDKPLVKYCTDRFVGYGTPWEGKERIGKNTSVPLDAVCFIEKSPTNSIRKLSREELINRIFGQIHIPSDPACASRIITLADALTRHVDAYLLRCDISRDAAELSYNTIMGNL